MVRVALDFENPGALPVQHSSADDDLAAIAARYPALTLPVAMLYGRDDEVVEPKIDGERAVAAIPGAVLEMTEGGHMLPVAHPRATVAFIRAMADRLFVAPT